MTERIRTMVFATQFFIGGTERQIATLVAGLDPARYDVHVGCLDFQGEFLDDIRRRNVPVSIYPIRRLYGPRAMVAQIRLVRYLRKHRMQVMHSFGFYPNVFAIPAARMAAVPAVVGSLRDMGDVWTARQRRAQRWACALAHHVIANANAIRERAIEEGYAARRLSVIHNGLDTARFSAAQDPVAQRDRFGLPRTGPVVGVFSRLNHPIKGIDRFLQAAALLGRRVPEARFLIVGDGPLRAHLEGQARHLGIEGATRFIGAHVDLAGLMPAVTVAVVPSLSEGLSNSLLEAMAAGLPVVATRVGGTPEVVSHGRTGLLVPPGDPRELANAIERLIRDPAFAASCGSAGQADVRERFSLQRMIGRTEALYESLLETRHPHRAPRPAGAGHARQDGGVAASATTAQTVAPHPSGGSPS